MINVAKIVRDAEENYIDGSIKRGKYVDYNMYEIVETIQAYTNDTHTSGKEDSLGREKPFFNIVTAAENIWYRATDLDRKNCKVLPKKSSQVVSAFLATVLLQNWMDDHRFGMFLNKWGRHLARFGSAIVEWVEKDGDISFSVNTWDKFIPDPTDFDAIPRIKKFYKTIEQLKKIKAYNKEVVKSLEDALTNRKTLEGHNIDNESNFIEIYEVHGDLPSYLLKKDPQEPEKDEDIKYQWQMHTVCFMKNDKGDYDDFTLFKGPKKEDTHMITHLIEEEGRTISRGAVESLFDAQWMTNHSIKQWKDQVDLASKLIFQTADKNYIGRNVLSAIETGDIMVHEDNKPLTLINNQGHDITSIQSFIEQWKILGQEVTSTPDAVRANTPPSNTPLGTTQINLTQGLSLFEIMTENKGFYVEDMLKKVVKHIKKRLKGNKDEIVAILDAQGITEIDTMYIPNEARRRYMRRTVDAVLNRKVAEPFNEEIEQGALRQELQGMGNRRFFKPDELDQKTWDAIIDDEVWDNLTYEVTNENADKQATLQSLSQIFQILATINPQKAEMVADKIMAETGVVTPMELSSLPPAPLAPAPTGGGGVDLQGLTKMNG